MQRIASQSRHGSLLPTIVGKGIDPASGLCRGEQELYILLRRSQWNDLGPLCRMTLLRDCAHQHNQWAQFTAKCQLWVLHEVARASGEIRQQAGSPLTDEAAVESREALEFVRMKSLVQADPSLARELTDLYEQTPSLIAPVQRLRMELRAQDERTSLALSRSQSMFRVGAPRRNTSPSGSPQSGRHSRMSMTSPTAMRQAQQRTQSPAGRNEARSLARTASAPELNSREITIRPGRLAPLLNERRAAGCAAAPGDSRSGRGSRRKGKNQPAAKDDVSGDKLEKIKEGRRKSISKEKPEATAEESPAANNGTRDAPSYEEYFKGGTEELVPQEAEEGQEPQNTRMLARTFFTLLPTQSSAGKAAKQRNDRRKVVKAAVARTTEVAKAAHAKLRGLPTAFVYVEGPGAELKKVLQEIERATQDIHVSIAESMDVTTASEETITYEVLINDDITLSRLCEILESSFASKKLPYMVRTRPPYERVLVAFSQAFPGLGKVAFADLEALMLVVAESYRLYAMAWADLKSVKDVAKEIEELQTKESRILCANELVDIADERTQNMPADLLRHSANSGDDVLADAITAHLKIKEMLAPGTDWAQADLNDLEEVPADDPCRNWECRVDGAFKNAVHHDPGVVIPGGSTGLEDRAKPNLRPYELELQVCEEVFVSHIDITFEYFPAIAMAVDELVEGFPVVWVENMFVRPNALGERYVSVGVRVSWEAEGGVHLQYVAELRLHQQAMRAVSLGTPMSECKEQMLAALDACGLQPQQINVAMEVFLRAVDCNEEALKRRSSRDLERVSSWIFDVTNELEEVLTEADIQSCYNLVAEFAEQARASGLPEIHVQRLVNRSRIGTAQEEQEWRVQEAERIAKERKEREAREAEARRLKEDEERRILEEEAARVAAEEAADREVAELKAAKKAADEAKRRAKEDDVARKAAEREAEKKRIADLEARAKEVAETFLATVGLENIHAMHPSGKTALLLASAEGVGEVVESLLMRNADIRAMRQEDGGSVLHEAAAAGCTEAMEVLMRWGAAVEAQTEQKMRPVHFAAMSGEVAALEMLLEAGAKFDTKSADGNTPLFAAAMKDKVATADLLLQKGAELDQKDDAGRTILHVAALNNAGEIAKYVVEKGVDPGMKDNDGKTALQLAKKSKSAKVLEVLQAE